MKNKMDCLVDFGESFLQQLIQIAQHQSRILDQAGNDQRIVQQL